MPDAWYYDYQRYATTTATTTTSDVHWANAYTSSPMWKHVELPVEATVQQMVERYKHSRRTAPKSKYAVFVERMNQFNKVY